VFSPSYITSEKPIWNVRGVGGHGNHVEYILEAIVTISAALVYGTEERPRPAILRNTVRVVGFGGAALALATLIGILQLPPILAFATPVWVLCLLIVLMAEHVIGRTVLSFAALFSGGAVVVAAIAAAL